jgi:hypothetical protein
MATFTAAQVTSLAVMFASNSDLMGDHLGFHEELISEDDKTAIIAQVTRYENGTVTGKVWFEGTESNEGFNMSTPFAASNRDPREIVAGLIHWQWVNYSGGGRLSRC